LEGGSWKPIVNINGYGYLTTSDAAIPVTPTITALQSPTGSTPVTTGGTNGGTPIKIVGTNFPIDGSLPADLTDLLEVYFGTVKATIKSYNPTQIIVDSPSGTGSVQVTVKTNGVASPTGISYLYDANLNVSLDPSPLISFSPVLKNKLTLRGTNFLAAKKSDLQVVLKQKLNGALTYVLPVT